MADPSTVHDAVAAAKELFEQLRGSSNKAAASDAALGAPEAQLPVLGYYMVDPPPRSKVLSLRARPKQIVRADAGDDVGGAYAAIAPSLFNLLIHKARHQPDWALFDAAVQKEVNSLSSNGTRELIELPEGKMVTGTQTLCECKRGADYAVSRYSGRFAARGDTHVCNGDYNATWAPVARHANLRVVLSDGV